MKKAPVIFYAEDDKDDQDIFHEILSTIAKDAVVHYQNNTDQLLQALRDVDELPDLLFLDLNMPGKNGFEALQEVREIDKCKNLAVIILSTSQDAAQAERCKKLGANLYVTKPQEYSRFKEALKLVLSIDWSKYSPATKEFFINLNK